MRSVVLGLLALSPLAALAESPTPLLDYAQELSFATLPNEPNLRARLTEATHQIEQNPPPAEDCAKTLGAARFALLYEQLGWSRSGLGDYAGAIEAYEKALECDPRATRIHAQLASDLMHDGRLAEARKVALRAQTIDRDNLQLTTTLAQLDFLEERWADAVARLRSAVNEEPDDMRATYWQCFLWLAQRRAGIEEPELVAREPADDWPKEVLDTLRGTMTEEELLEVIREEDNELRRRTNLTEALYYVGQLRLAQGRMEEARRYFAATVNLKVLYFVEHYMARMELAKMRGPTRVATPPTG